MRKRKNKRRKGRTGIKMFAILYFLGVISFFFIRRKIEKNIILNKEGADLALVEVSDEINIDIFTPICLPESGKI